MSYPQIEANLNPPDEKPPVMDCDGCDASIHVGERYCTIGDNHYHENCAAQLPTSTLLDLIDVQYEEAELTDESDDWR